MTATEIVALYLAAMDALKFERMPPASGLSLVYQIIWSAYADTLAHYAFRPSSGDTPQHERSR